MMKTFIYILVVSTLLIFQSCQSKSSVQKTTQETAKQVSKSEDVVHTEAQFKITPIEENVKIESKDLSTSQSAEKKPSSSNTIEKVAEKTETSTVKNTRPSTPSSTPPTTKPQVPAPPQTTETVKNEIKKIDEKVTPKKETIVAPPPKEPIPHTVEPAPKKKPPHLHQVYNGLLSKHVSSGGSVNYDGLKKDEATLDGYLERLSTTSLIGKTKDERLAFWINAYNAFTLKKILNNYPVKSITDLDGGKPWDVKWIKLDGQNLSLNNIENDIIRPQFKEPRIHFAVNCAAKSCPPLLNKAWTAKNLEANFEKQTKAFVNSAHNKISPDQLQLSKIFEWYGEDFSSVEKFIRKYSDTAVNPGATISYLDYDWSLNQ